MLVSKRLGKIRVGKISSVILDDFLLVCGLRVNINATIIGDATGHIFEWELITGSPQGITYMSTLDGLMLDYIIQIPPGVREDKKFRFWIDKGSTRQKYYDIWVWSSFVDTYYSNNTKDISINDHNFISQTGIEQISAWVGYASQYYPNETNSTYHESKPVLLWKEPSTNNYNYLLYYSIEQYDLTTHNWITYKTNAVNYIDLDISSNISYRVVATYYNKLTSQLSRVYSNVVSYNSTDTRGQNANLIFNDHLYNAGGAINDANTVTNIVNYTNTNLTIIEDYQAVFLASNTNEANMVTSYVNFTNTNLVNNSEIINSVTYDTAVNNNNIVTAYTVFSNINIGG